MNGVNDMYAVINYQAKPVISKRIIFTILLALTINVVVIKTQFLDKARVFIMASLQTSQEVAQAKYEKKLIDHQADIIEKQAIVIKSYQAKIVNIEAKNKKLQKALGSAIIPEATVGSAFSNHVSKPTGNWISNTYNGFKDYFGIGK
jgi:hypothetical protein